MFTRRDFIKGSAAGLAFFALPGADDVLFVDFDNSRAYPFGMYHGVSRTDPDRAPWVSNREGVKALRDSLNPDYVRIVAEGPAWIERYSVAPEWAREYDGTLPLGSLKGRAMSNLEGMIKGADGSRVILGVSQLPEKLKDPVRYLSGLVESVARKFGGSFTLELDSGMAGIWGISNNLGRWIKGKIINKEFEDVRLALGVDYGENLSRLLREIDLDSLCPFGINLHLYNYDLSGDPFDNSSRVFYDYVRDVGRILGELKKSWHIEESIPLSVSEHGVSRGSGLLNPQQEAAVLGLNIINMARARWVRSHCYFQQTADGIRPGGLWTSDAVKRPSYDVLKAFNDAFPCGSSFGGAEDTKNAGYIFGARWNVRHFGVVNKTNGAVEVAVDFNECSSVEPMIGTRKPTVDGTVMREKLLPYQVEIYRIK